MLSTLIHRIAGLIAAVFLPLAAGALWSALSLKFSAELPAMALLCAAATWPARTHLPGRSAAVRGVLSVLICAIGITYAYWLKSATVVARAIGVSFGDALMSIGSDLTVAIASARSNGSTLAFIVAALLLSLWIGWRREASAYENAMAKPQSAP
jgi:hypothetical protein